MSSFFKTLSSLQNPEKTRNFNVFKGYQLDDFQKHLESFGLFPYISNKQNEFRFSVVGTNGKGSTSHYLATLINQKQDSLKVGLYTSPHLVSPLERIMVNGRMITEQEADEIITHLMNLNHETLLKLSYFECLTLVCMYFFEKKQCQFEVWEAGLGGRLDATKLINPDVVILTRIGLDHKEILGDTPEKIVTEKLHIVGSNTKVIYSFEENSSLRNKIEEVAASLHVPVRFHQTDATDNYLESNFEFAHWCLVDLGILPSSTKVSWDQFPRPKGRLEAIHKAPLLVFDPAHNPSAVKHTLQILRKQESWRKASILLGILPDKDAEGIWKEISEFDWEHTWIYRSDGFFQWESLQDPRVQKITNLEVWKTDFQQSLHPCIAIGSFRLYPVLTSLFQKNVNL
ncbi:MAG: Mur ligase family protein [Leptospira sp.]|nr:Mur ligase family protein [Leptospira sp.]